MEIINTIIGTPLGWVMWLCYRLLQDYGLAILLFTLLTKVLMFPISLLVQKNSIKMVKMKPQLDALRHQYTDDQDAFLDAQTALYRKEHYSPMAGVWPLLLQLPIIFGLLDVVYKPLKHLLHLSGELQQALVDRALSLGAEAGSAIQLTALEMMRAAPSDFADVAGAEVLQAVQGLRLTFCGINLAETPDLLHPALIWVIPVLAGLSALLMCYIQNQINVLQIEQGALAQWGMTAFMVAFSGFFAFIVPAGVGLYWTFGNLFSIGVMYLVNAIYSPKKYIDYKVLEEMKQAAAAEKALEKQNRRTAKKYYREFFAAENQKDMHLVFYSEGSGYYKYFQNLIEALLRDSNEVIHYVTSDPNDAVFQKNEPRIRPYYVDEARLISLMMKLDTDIVVMTTPDLDKYHIKRSKVRTNIEYIYIDHGCTSLNLTYRTGALDAFSTIFVVSRAQAIEVRAMEKLRHTRKKRIVEVGYGLIDNMIAAYEASEKHTNEKPTILIAPSWQYDNIMDSCLDDLIGALYGKGWRIVVRPHPQYVRRFPMQLQQIIERHRDKMGDDFTIETDFSSNVTVYTADLLITDWSSIAYEFSFATNKPTLFVNTQMKVVNPDYRKIPFEPFDLTGRSRIGRSIEKDEAKEAGRVAAELLDGGAAWNEQIDRLKHEYFYNLGHSGEAGARYILHRLERRRTREAGR